MLIDDKPLSTTTVAGQYSTVIRPDKMVETLFFPRGKGDGDAVVVSLRSVQAMHEQAITEHQAKH